MNGARQVAVIGGGPAGLAAAYELTIQPDVRVTLLEAGDRPGGKIRTTPFRGLRVDEGADNVLARVPDGVGLFRELGLEAEFVSPAVGSAKVWVDDHLVPLPSKTVLGAPLEFEEFRRVLSPAGFERAAAEPDLPGDPLLGDASIGSVMRARYGDELVDRVLGALVGGVNAGDIDRLSLDAVTPQLAEAAHRGPSITVALRELQAERPPAPGPVFIALRPGTQSFTDALADRITAAGGIIRTGARATALHRAPDGRITITLADGGTVEADAAVVATPAWATAPLLTEVAPAAAAMFGAIEHVSVAFTTLAFRRADLPVALDASGFLVPRTAGRFLAAASFGSVKWPHWANEDEVVVRASVGHAADQRHLAMSDDEVVGLLLADLADALGAAVQPLEARVTRWDDAFPQYTPGHLDRVDEAERVLAEAAPNITLAGMALRGIGLPASIGGGRRAARAVA